MSIISIGRVRHGNSKEIAADVHRYLNGGEICDGTAAGIAAGFQSPSRADAPFLLLAQGSPVDKTDLRHAIRREIDSGQYGDDSAENVMLHALLSWVHFH
jgi:hypothetical protein